MKKPFDAHDWTMIILAATIPLAIISVPIIKLTVGGALSESSAGVINNLLTAIGVGLLQILIYRYKKNDDETKPPI